MYTELVNQIISVYQERLFDPMDAVVFDIDDTVITQLGEAIPSIIHLVKFFRFKGAAIFFITARVGDPDVKLHTEYQMRSLGIPYNAIYYRSSLFSDPWVFKEGIRCALGRNFRIFMSVGDKPWDIGKCGGIGVLLKETEL